MHFSASVGRDRRFFFCRGKIRRRAARHFHFSIFPVFAHPPPPLESNIEMTFEILTWTAPPRFFANFLFGIFRLPLFFHPAPTRAFSRVCEGITGNVGRRGKAEAATFQKSRGGERFRNLFSIVRRRSFSNVPGAGVENWFRFARINFDPRPDVAPLS